MVLHKNATEHVQNCLMSLLLSVLSCAHFSSLSLSLSLSICLSVFVCVCVCVCVCVYVCVSILCRRVA